MIRLPISSKAILCVVSTLIGAAALAGCGLGPSSPVSDAEPATSQLGPIQGSNYGGHAPIVGAHVFVLEGYTSGSGTGYGQPAKSLLSASYTGSYPTAKEPAGTAVAGDYYVTTDANGIFNISGDYTCDAGYPVYLYAEGGNPRAPTAYQPSLTITGATISGTGPYTITFTVSAPSLLYQGEIVTFTGSGGTLGTYLNGTLQTVLADANLTTTTFDITVGLLTNNGVTVPTGTQNSIGTLTLTQTSAPNNPAVVNLAVLGLCPSTGTANFSYLNFVYMNEVSTAAAAYALGGFFPAPGSSGLTVAGAAAANLSIPNSTLDPSGYSLALLGLQNATLTASQLYDIQGSNSACTPSPTCDGETHIARPTTVGILTGGTTTNGSPNVTNVFTTGGLAVGMSITGANLPAAGATITAIGTNTLTLSTGTGVTAGTSSAMFAGSGSGTVPQALIDTIGNVLANCVDSANTSGSASSQCTSLFSNARSAGTSGTTPIDTASAAIDIAHNPWANVSALVGSVINTAPFQPSLSSATDLSVGITYTPAHVANPEGMAIDGKGQVWYANPISGYVTALNPIGGVQYNVLVAGFDNYIAIDGNNNAWFNNSTTQSLNRISSAGTYIGAYQVAGNYIDLDVGVAVDGTNDTGYIYAGRAYDGITASSMSKFDGNGNVVATPGDPLSGSVTCLANQNPGHSAADSAANGYNLWISSETGSAICKINTLTGAQIFKFSVPAAYGTGPEFPAIDSSGNVWFGTQTNSAVIKLSQSGAATYPTGGNLSGTFGAAVDGDGNVFFANRTSNSVAKYLGSTNAAVSTINMRGGGSATVMNDPLNLQIDLSGNAWITNYTGSRIVELVGVGAPTWQPLADAGYHNKLGSRP